MFRLPIRICFFLSAYAPVLFLLILQIIGNDKIPAQGRIIGAAFLSILIVGSVASLIFFLCKKRKKSKAVTLKIESITPCDDMAMMYLGTYLIPFLNPPLQDWMVLVTLFITFVVIGILDVLGNNLTANPIMLLLGYHFFDITLEDSKRGSILISTKHYLRGDKIEVVTLGEYSYLEKAYTPHLPKR